MFKRILFVVPIFLLTLTACSGGTPLPPTANPVDMQNTAIAAAQTIVAATALAIPTATLVPPPTVMPSSPTPLPTFTPDLSSAPTFMPLMAQPTATTGSILGDTNAGECNRLLDIAEAGPTYPVQIRNISGGEALVSLYLNKNTFGQCGYMPEKIVRGSISINLPTGNWYFYALIDYGKGRSGNDYGNFLVQPGGATDTVKIVRR